MFKKKGDLMEIARVFDLILKDYWGKLSTCNAVP
jgi:hypothetical protein